MNPFRPSRHQWPGFKKSAGKRFSKPKPVPNIGMKDAIAAASAEDQKTNGIVFLFCTLILVHFVFAVDMWAACAGSEAFFGGGLFMKASFMNSNKEVASIVASFICAPIYMSALLCAARIIYKRRFLPIVDRPPSLFAFAYKHRIQNRKLRALIVNLVFFVIVLGPAYCHGYFLDHGITASVVYEDGNTKPFSKFWAAISWHIEGNSTDLPHTYGGYLPGFRIIKLSVVLFSLSVFLLVLWTWFTWWTPISRWRKRYIDSLKRKPSKFYY